MKVLHGEVFSQRLRRIKLIPFDHVVPKEDRDRNLEQKLKAEASGVLNWLLVGARAHHNGEIRVPHKVVAATDQYLHDNDSVRGFLKDETTRDPNDSVPAGDLYDAYVRYCEDEFLILEKKGTFGKIIEKMGFERTRTNTTREWKGLRFKTDEDNRLQWGRLSPRGEGMVWTTMQ